MVPALRWKKSIRNRIHEERAMAHDVSNEAEIAEKFWKALQSDKTVMLGLAGVDEAHTRPMTAQFDEGREQGPIWFFTAKDTELVNSIGADHRAVASFSSKGHELFASLHGELTLDNDRAVIDRLWNPFVAAWFEGGKEDPKLQLIRFDPEHAQVWLNENSMFAGIKMLLGRDPKKDYQGKVADVRLS
jgi:general stress protein 26